MKKILMATMLILILTGCTGIGLNFPNKNTISIPTIREGTKGIEINYLDNLPPAELFEGQLFEVGFELKNQGAEDVQNGIYTLGLNEQYIIMLDESMNRFNAPGKSTYNPLGGQERIILKAKANQLGGQLASQSTTIITNACYEYRTTATINACIDPQQLKKEQKVCTIKTITQSGGQGGPVAVTKVEQQMLPHEDPDKMIPTYTIYIQNSGTGQIIESGQIYDACTGRNIDKDDYDRVAVTATLSNYLLSCEPTQIKLTADNNKIFCRLGQGISKSAGNYQAPLTIDLEYGYMQTKPKTIRIIKTNK